MVCLTHIRRLHGICKIFQPHNSNTQQCDYFLPFCCSCDGSLCCFEGTLCCLEVIVSFSNLQEDYSSSFPKLYLENMLIQNLLPVIWEGGWKIEWKTCQHKIQFLFLLLLVDSSSSHSCECFLWIMSRWRSSHLNLNFIILSKGSKSTGWCTFRHRRANRMPRWSEPQINKLLD